MAYAVKYRTSYKRRTGGTTTIDILENGYGGSITELIADQNPLIISRSGDVNNIYTPTIGSGATIKLFVSPLTLLDLFSVDPQKFVVKIYNGSSGGTLIWQGFLSPGIYSEDYSTSQLTPISIECNDGMAVLENIPYLTSATGTTYSGFVTVSEVMSNIFSKLGISFTTIISNSDLKVADFSRNPFLYLTVNQGNYIDEQGKPMSCRKVLETIWGALGLVMSFRANTIYLIDPINLHSTTAYTYGTSPVYGYMEQDYSYGGYLDISADQLNYYETGQRLDITQPFNQVEIKYDPYNITNLEYNFNGTYLNSTGGTENNASNLGTYGTYTNDGTTYNVYTDVLMKGWTISGTNKFEGFQKTGSTIDFVIRQQTGYTGYFEYTFPNSTIKQDDALRIEFSMDIYANTKHISNLWSTAAGTLVQEIRLPVYVKVGDYWYNGSGWQTGITSTTMTIRTPDTQRITKYVKDGWWLWRHTDIETVDNSEINDTWTTASVIIDMTRSRSQNLIKGPILIRIDKNLNMTTVIPSDARGQIKNALIKNICVQAVDTKLIPITNEGILTQATLYNNNTIKKSSLDITLNQGCGNFGVSRAAFSTDQQTVQGINITGLIRGDKKYDTAHLLAQSLISQYKAPRFKLTANFDVSQYGLSIEHKLIKDTNYLATRAFYITNCTYIDDQENMYVEMIEITSTRENIV